MSVNIVPKSDCCGCSACASACPKNCIAMLSDEEGFLYPDIDTEICIKCGLCEKACHILTPIFSHSEPLAFAAINNNKETRLNSSSGGIFSLLAEYIINNGGAVFGAAFDNEFKVKHKCATTFGELKELIGSKYVQSEIGTCYEEAKKILDNGNFVLFTGTPCQIDGLYAYLKQPYEKLYTQDLICHGVPSPKVWKKYLNFREKKAASKTQRTFFRHKKYGWKTFSVQLQFCNRTEYEQIFSKDLFMQGFLANLYLRPSCYNCHSKSLKRNSDITLADFWGVEKILPEMFDDRGTSLVFINTAKGQSLFDAISDKMLIKQTDISKAVEYNTAAFRSVKINKNREKFFKEFDVLTFEKLIKKYVKRSSFFNRVFFGVLRRARKFLGKILKG